MTYADVIDFILTYIEMNSKNKNKNKNSETKERRGETITYGRCDEYGNPVSWEDGG